jgi:hypothetical protein
MLHKKKQKHHVFCSLDPIYKKTIDRIERSLPAKKKGHLVPMESERHESNKAILDLSIWEWKFGRADKSSSTKENEILDLSIWELPVSVSTSMVG